MLALFDNTLYPDLTVSLQKALNALDDDGYATRREEPCVELARAYNDVAHHALFHRAR